jgi:hypothetical protein
LLLRATTSLLVLASTGAIWTAMGLVPVGSSCVGSVKGGSVGPGVVTGTGVPNEAVYVGGPGREGVGRPGLALAVLGIGTAGFDTVLLPLAVVELTEDAVPEAESPLVEPLGPELLTERLLVKVLVVEVVAGAVRLLYGTRREKTGLKFVGVLVETNCVSCRTSALPLGLEVVGRLGLEAAWSGARFDNPPPSPPCRPPRSTDSSPPPPPPPEGDSLNGLKGSLLS